VTLGELTNWKGKTGKNMERKGENKGALTLWIGQREERVRTQKNREGGALTAWKAHRRERVVTKKESGQAKDTHELESAEEKIRTAK